MALQPGLKLLIGIEGDSLYIQDSTGAYTLNNVGGWGDPNQERNELALVVFASRQDTSDVIAEVIGDQAVWASGLTNQDVSQFQIKMDKDGIYSLYLFAIKVSTDGVNDLEANALVSGDFVYYQNEVQTFDGTGFTVLEPYQYGQMIDNEDIPQVFCEDIIMSKLKIEYNKRYKEYMQKRNANCEDIEDDFRDVLGFRMDIEYTDYAFRSNLKTTARKNIESMTNVN